MVCQMSSSAITSPAITPCTITTSYFPVRGRQSSSRPPALAYLPPNNCAIFRGGVCGPTSTFVASNSMTRARFGDVAAEWQEGLNPGVGATWSAGLSFLSGTSARAGTKRPLFPSRTDQSKFLVGGCSSCSCGLDPAAGGGEIGAVLAEFSQSVILRAYYVAAERRGNSGEQEIANGARFQ